MPARSALLPTLPLLASLAACAPSGSYPSLAPRPGEIGAVAQAPAPPAHVAATNDSELAARLAELVAEGQRGQAAFEAALGDAGARIARAGPAGSDSWVEAQEALSQVEAARAPTASALSELDALARAKMTDGASSSPADLAAIASATETVRAIADRQDVEIDRLSGSLATL
jgi:hypothetical protein